MLLLRRRWRRGVRLSPPVLLLFVVLPVDGLLLPPDCVAVDVGRGGAGAAVDRAHPGGREGVHGIHLKKLGEVSR